MGSIEAYSQQFKQDIINRYHQSGLTTYKFCKLRDVTISVSTLKRWVGIHRVHKSHTDKNLVQETESKNLNIV